MKFTYPKRHKLMPKDGCAICGGEPMFQGVFVPNGSLRLYGYPMCGKCQKAVEKDPSLLTPLEEMLVKAGEDEDRKHKGPASCGGLV